jgi:hypothetical protein
MDEAVETCGRLCGDRLDDRILTWANAFAQGGLAAYRKGDRFPMAPAPGCCGAPSSGPTGGARVPYLGAVLVVRARGWTCPVRTRSEARWLGGMEKSLTEDRGSSGRVGFVK